MTKQASNKIPLKTLIKASQRLFFVFLIGSLTISSLQNFSFTTLGQRAITLGSLFILLFVVNTLLIYYFDKNRKKGPENIWKKIFLVGYLFSFIIFSIHYYLINWLEQQGFSGLAPDHPDLQGWRLFAFLLFSSLVVYSFIFLIQNSVLHQYERNRIQMELLELKASNSEAVNQLLRQQIQPHFLFNALNILKSLIKREPQKAEDYLLRLSDFLRVSISENTSGTASIEAELKICNDYMEMQSIRFGKALKYQIAIPKTDSVFQQKLPFFSLQPLLENAIKHNQLTTESPLYIKIEHVENYIKVSNNLQEKQQMEQSSGNGLRMLKERYKILNDEKPIIKTDGEIYSVSLKIL